MDADKIATPVLAKCKLQHDFYYLPGQKKPDGGDWYFALNDKEKSVVLFSTEEKAAKFCETYSDVELVIFEIPRPKLMNWMIETKSTIAIDPISVDTKRAAFFEENIISSEELWS